jgi:hypothetical protein
MVPMAPKPLFGEEQERDIIERYIAGETYQEIADAYGCSKKLRKMLRRQGVQPRSRGGRFREFSADEVTEMARRWEAGESQHAIAQSLGISQTHVGRLLSSRGYAKEIRHPRGSDHGSWKGGRARLSEGYFGVRVDHDDPLAVMGGTTGYVPEHRLVMARSLGRPLTSSETVHHINGDRADNRLENLQLRSGRHGNGVAYTCRACGSHDVEAREL